MTVQPRRHFSVASIALFLGGLLWIAAFWLPVFSTAERDIAGYWVFVSGWMGFVVLQFAWYANLLILIAVILMYSSPVRATVFAALALLVATQAFWFNALPETTQSVAITAKGIGFWLWYAGIFLMSLGVFFCSETDEVTDANKTSRARKDLMSPKPLPKAAPPLATQRKHQAKKAVATTAEETVADKAAPEAKAIVAAEATTVVAAERVTVMDESISDKQASKPKTDNANKTDEINEINKVTTEKLESTVPAVLSIINDAVFPGIKKPEP